MHWAFAVGVAAAAEILIVIVMTMAWPAKAAEGAIPVAIVVCGLLGPVLTGPWYRVAVAGAALGLLNAAVFIGLSRALEAAEKFAVLERVTISTGFGAATVLGTWLWTQHARRGRS